MQLIGSGKKNAMPKVDVPPFLRSVALTDGTFEGTIHEDDVEGYICWPADSGLILLDGEWTPAQLRAIADYVEAWEEGPPRVVRGVPYYWGCLPGEKFDERLVVEFPKGDVG